jgi:methylmalonyl-CoA epimerase
MKPLVAHIGIAVKDLAASIEKYRLLTGVEPSEVHLVPDQKVKVAFLASESDDPEGFPRLELVAPDHPDSPIAKFIERRGEGLHHICLLVENLKERLGELKQAGVRLIDEEPRVGAEGDLIAFVHPSATGGVLIELQQA